MLHFNPLLPVGVDCLRVCLRYRRHHLEVEATRSRLRVRSRPALAPMIEIAYRSHFRKLSPGDSHEFRLIRPSERKRGNVRGETTDAD